MLRAVGRREGLEFVKGWKSRRKGGEAKAAGDVQGFLLPARRDPRGRIGRPLGPILETTKDQCQYSRWVRGNSKEKKKAHLAGEAALSDAPMLNKAGPVVDGLCGPGLPNVGGGVPVPPNAKLGAAAAGAVVVD